MTKTKLAFSRLPADVLARAKVIAALRGQTVPDALGQILRPALDREERDAFSRFAKPATDKSRTEK
jgi:hypothetical protein